MRFVKLTTGYLPLWFTEGARKFDFWVDPKHPALLLRRSMYYHMLHIGRLRSQGHGCYVHLVFGARVRKYGIYGPSKLTSPQTLIPICFGLGGWRPFDEGSLDRHGASALDRVLCERCCDLAHR